MRIVLAGSPSIALPAFAEVIKHFTVLAIVTQPDRPQGRGLRLTPTPVAELGIQNGIPVFKPEKINTIFDDLVALNYDLLLSFAYGQIIPEKVLAIGKFPPLNIHGSLLPLYRGAAPVHHAIINGDQQLGITLMRMVKQMDAGEMYFKASQAINEYTTTGQGLAIIAELARQNIVNWLQLIANGLAKPQLQPANFTLSPKLAKDFGILHGGLTIYEMTRRVRALNPVPGAVATIAGQQFKVFDVSKTFVTNAPLLNACDGHLYVTEYQQPGKRIVKLRTK